MPDATAQRPAHTPDRPRIDIGVVTWNTRDITPNVLRELIDTDHGCDIRVLVRDNASADGTAAQIAANVPEADLDAGDDNLGFAGGVNLLLERSTAPWFFLMNPDAWPLPGTISALVTAAEAHPRAAAVVPRIERPDGTLEHSTHPFPSVRIAAMSALGPRAVGRERADRNLLNGAWMHDRARRVDWAIGAGWLLRRAAIEDVGGLDESYFMYAEDLEWCWRAQKRGWEIWFEPAAVLRHLSNVSGEISYGDQRTHVHARNAYRFYQREHPALSTFAWWTMTVAGPALRYAGARVRGRDAKAAVWKDHLLAHWRARRPGVHG